MQIVTKTTRAVCDHKNVSKFYLVSVSDWNPESPLHGKILAYALLLLFFISDIQKFRAHRATVEIYRTRGAITKIQFLKVLKFKIPFMIILRLVFVGKSRHVITLSRRGWLHSAGSQRKISQRAQVRGKQKEERGAPQITLLPSNAALVIRLEVRSRKSDEACF